VLLTKDSLLDPPAHTGFPAKGLGSCRDSIYPLQMSEELVVTTPQPVYVLPRDHKFHSGEFYSQNSRCKSAGRHGRCMSW